VLVSVFGKLFGQNAVRKTELLREAKALWEGFQIF
jgi:hypothetical protein